MSFFIIRGLPALQQCFRDVTITSAMLSSVGHAGSFMLCRRVRWIPFRSELEPCRRASHSELTCFRVITMTQMTKLNIKLTTNRQSRWPSNMTTSRPTAVLLLTLYHCLCLPLLLLFLSAVGCCFVIDCSSHARTK